MTKPHLDKSNNQWVFTGSRDGLLNFRDILLMYAENPSNDRLSEHDHYGTYLQSYLKVMTWHQPGIDADSIHGRISDLRKLAGMVESKLENALSQTVISIGPEYSQDSEFLLVFRVMQDSFDPASMDSLLKE